MPRRLSGIYAITDELLTPPESIVSQVERALKAGAKIIQFRDKTRPDSLVEVTCMELQRLCIEHDALFIIDDRAELVASIGADGLHIGKDDIPLDQARAIVGQNAVIGVSCYGSLHKAAKAQQEGADYVAFGSFFPSPTKPGSNVVDKALIERAKSQLQIPVCVIGGINADNIDQLTPYGPDMYSMVSGVFGDDAIEENMKKIQSKLK